MSHQHEWPESCLGKRLLLRVGSPGSYASTYSSPQEYRLLEISPSRTFVKLEHCQGAAATVHNGRHWDELSRVTLVEVLPDLDSTTPQRAAPLVPDVPKTKIPPVVVEEWGSLPEVEAKYHWSGLCVPHDVFLTHGLEKIRAIAQAYCRDHLPLEEAGARLKRFHDMIGARYHLTFLEETIATGVAHSLAGQPVGGEAFLAEMRKYIKNYDPQQVFTPDQLTEKFPIEVRYHALASLSTVRQWQNWVMNQQLFLIEKEGELLIQRFTPDTTGEAKTVEELPSNSTAS